MCLQFLQLSKKENNIYINSETKELNKHNELNIN